ncbi:MAG: hypothetical protein NVS9B4_00560 [Candidatus Acidiferrum sp.]
MTAREGHLTAFVVYGSWRDDVTWESFYEYIRDNNISFVEFSDAFAKLCRICISHDPHGPCDATGPPLEIRSASDATSIP